MNTVASELRQFTTTSGLRVLHLERTAAPVVAAQLWVGVGSGDERPNEAGLAHVLEHMVFKGSERRPAGTAAREIEALGGSINAWTSFDQTVYHIVVPATGITAGLDVLTDLVLAPRLDADDLTRELEVIQEEIRRGQDAPVRVLSEALFAEVFRVHPYGRPVIGTSQSIAAFDRQLVASFHARWYQPSNMTLVVVGDISADDLQAQLTRVRSTSVMPVEDNRGAPRAEEPSQNAPRVVVRQRDTRSAHVALAFRGPGLSHPDTPALDLLATLLGDGEGAILVDRMQRGLALAEGTWASLYAPQEAGLFLVGATFGTGGDGTAATPTEVLRALADTLADVRDGRIGRATLERARRVLLTRSLQRRRTVEDVAGQLGFFQTVAGDPTFDTAYQARVEAVDVATLQDAARRWLVAESATVGVLIAETEPAPDVAALQRAMEDGLRSRVAGPALIPDAYGVVRHEMASGAVLLIATDETSPLVTVRAAVRAGNLWERPGTLGATGLLAGLLTSGTETRDQQSFGRQVDALGVTMSGFATAGSLGLQMSVPGDALEDGAALFCDALLAARPSTVEVDRLRREAMQGVVAAGDDPATQGFDALARTMWGDHPVGRPARGDVASLQRLDWEALVAFRDGLLVPERLVVAVVGDVDPLDVVEAFEPWLGRHVAPESAEGGRGAFAPPAWPAPVAQPGQATRITLERLQTHLVLGWPTVPASHPDAPALDLLAAILGGQGGRLFSRLRDQESLAYAVGAYAMSGIEAGSFALYLATSPDKEEQAVAGLRREVTRLRDDLVPQDELQRAATWLVGRRAVGLQRASLRASYLVQDELLHLGTGWSRGYADRLSSVTPAQLQEVATRWFVEAMAQEVRVGPGASGAQVPE